MFLFYALYVHFVTKTFMYHSHPQSFLLYKYYVNINNLCLALLCKRWTHILLDEFILALV